MTTQAYLSPLSYASPGPNVMRLDSKGYFSVYPANHMGRLEGTLQGATFASARVTALSDGHDAVRVFADSPEGMLRGIRLCINNEWNYPDIGIGNWCKPPLIVKDGYKGVVYLKLGAK